MRKLTEPYQIVSDPEATKSKILLESAKQFAQSSYDTVSIRDIANVIGILPGSVYAHFSSKKEIFDLMMESCEAVLFDYYQLLSELSYKADNFEGILDNIFIAAREVTNPFLICTIWCAMNTQYKFESSRHLYYDVYFVQGNAAMKRQLEIAIERKLAPPFDIETVGSLITNSLVTTVSFHIGYLNGFYEDFDIPQWYSKQIEHIISVVKKGK